MRGGLLRSWSSWSALLLLGGACSNIIGISNYDIDPSLDSQGGKAGAGGSAPNTTGGSKPQPSGGEAGEGAQGGSGTMPGAGAPDQGGEAGMAGAPVGGSGSGNVECTKAADCDDSIDCTVDSCTVNGRCSNTVDNSLCDADPGECVVCSLGIGCVASQMKVTQLLLDPNFDAKTGDWEEDIQDTIGQDFIVNSDPAAQSGGYSAWWLEGSELNVQAYADLLQYVTIPAGTLQLQVSGFYKVFPGVSAPDEDFVKAGLFEAGGSAKLLEFHTWYADEGAATDWVSFTYLAPTAQLKKIVGQEVTFDLYGYNWDSEFYFDTLKLEASICE